MITVPLSELSDALTRHVTMSLYRNGVVYGGVIYFLPNQESEPYNYAGYINAVGEFISKEGCACTDFISVANVVSVVVSGQFYSINTSVLYAYDADRQPLRRVVGTNATSELHVVEEDWAFVRACSSESAQYSLLLNFRSRG